MINEYKATDRMADLIESNYRLLQVISRFGMSLGFGDRSVEEVCRQNNVDTPTFLAVINFVESGYTQVPSTPEALSVVTLTNYLRQSHNYFLNFVFPRIHDQLHEVVRPDGKSAIPGLIHQQLDSYLASVTRHMRYEEAVLFPYVEGLMRGELDEGFNIAAFSQKHYSLDDDLRELKRILIQYNPECEDSNALNAILYQVYSCEDELDSHCKAEDYIFMPVVYHLEESVRNA